MAPPKVIKVRFNFGSDFPFADAEDWLSHTSFYALPEEIARPAVEREPERKDRG